MIHDKDMKMPFFPEKPENNEIFRRWWKDVAAYCERNRRFLGCTYVFKTIRGYQDRIDGPDYLKFFTEVNKSLPGDTSNLDWEGAIADKELLSALKHVMQGKCSDDVSRLSTHEGGFELLRLLSLKFDPVMPNLYQMLMAPIYGLANDKCKDFQGNGGESVAH